MLPLYINAYTAVSALGAGRAATRDALLGMRSALTPNDFAHAESVAGFIGRVSGVEDPLLPARLNEYDCRNQRIAWRALQADGFDQVVAAAAKRHGAHRVGVVVGTSTSGILNAELGYRARDPVTGNLPAWVRYRTTHNFGSLAEFVRAALSVSGPGIAISTACSSSAKAFATAARWIAAGVIDAAVVGGVDSLCGTTLHGFTSLQLVAPRPCRPFDLHRDGISLGEGGAFVLLERGCIDNPLGLALLGYGESADAHHMSAPHPDGLGAELAMRQALQGHDTTAAKVAFVHAHGTATRNNDNVESKAIARVLGPDTPITSTKGFTGHTLGAAGALGAVISLAAIEYGFIPGTANTTEIDPDCGSAIQLKSAPGKVEAVLENAFGFGGNNASLLFGKRPQS